MNGNADTAKHHRAKQRKEHALLHDAARTARISRADTLRHKHTEADAQCIANAAKQPGGGSDQADRGGGITTELAHHRFINILHNNERNLRQNGGDAQLHCHKD